MWVLLWVLLGVAAVVVAYVFVVRPWHMSWGATADEKGGALPGDDLIRQPIAQATHGITIDAPVADVWPWLVQMGQGRGGFYSYDWLENLFGCDIQNANQILPEFQQLSVGDGVRLHPQAPPLSVVMAEPNHAIVLAGGTDLQPAMPVDRSFLKLHTYRAFTWAFVLREQPGGCTRLIVRVRVAWKRGVSHFFRSRMFLEPAHSIMQRKMNLGIKSRSEARHL
jgi:hypothetical protein